ncbi:MAG: ClbS/DfsB family four-helix bundle protein [Caldilineaceae bacterium]
MNDLPQNTDELLERINADWTVLMALIAPLTEEQFARPAADGWAIKDQLAHLTHWENWLLRHHMQGEPAQDVMQVDSEMLEDFEVDQVNALIQARSHSRPTADILTELQQTHQQLIAALSALPFDKLLQPRYADDPEARPLLLWVAGDTYEHYQEHSAIIREQCSN